jgi:hypothetical protein
MHGDIRQGPNLPFLACNEAPIDRRAQYFVNGYRNGETCLARTYNKNSHGPCQVKRSFSYNQTIILYPQNLANGVARVGSRNSAICYIERYATKGGDSM